MTPGPSFQLLHHYFEAQAAAPLYRLLGGMLEWDLVEVAAGACLNDNCVLQTHLFEDRVLKAAGLRIGQNCSLGAASIVLYGSHREDGSSLDALSLLMKGERLPRGTAWAGIPAQQQLGPEP